jgi:mannose-1-phosphate guanylyltransferase
MTAAVVLCAGIGTRLSPLTDELAKPLMPVGSEPALGHILAALRSAGIREIGINTHHRPEDFARVHNGLLSNVHVVHEPRILGTAGGVTHVAAELDESDLVVCNGDIVAPALAIDALVNARRERGAALLWVVELAAANEGTVGLDARGNIVRLRGERFGVEVQGGNYLGVQVMGPADRERLPPEGCLVGDVALPWLREGMTIGTFLFDGDWDDIGAPAGLLRANLRWLARHKLASWKAPDAQVPSAAGLVQAVVGRAAHVEGAGLVSECVVLPEGNLVAPSHRVLAGRRARVVVPEQATGA